MRLVDADVLKVKQQEDADLFIGDDTLSGKSRRDEALNAVANIINAPTVDAVPVVRCKDCKHKPIGTGVNHDIEFPDDVCPCKCEDDWYSWMPRDDFFCAWGERRKDE